VAGLTDGFLNRRKAGGLVGFLNTSGAVGLIEGLLRYFSKQCSRMRYEMIEVLLAKLARL
jgi:hypothetical protein